jgi:hypothetical protein
MHGLATIWHLNDQAAAKAHLERYKKLLRRAISRSNWDRAQHLDGLVQDFEKFLDGRLTIFPDKKNSKRGLYVPSKGRDLRTTQGQSSPQYPGEIHVRTRRTPPPQRSAPRR